MTIATPDTSRLQAAEVRPRGLRGPVLLATDGHDATNAAAAVARDLASRLGATVEVISAVRPLQSYAMGWDAPLLPADVYDARRAAQRESVVRQLEPVLGPPTAWSLELRDGHPATVIAEAARDRGAALIVMGTGGHRTLDRLLGEEVTLQVIRRAAVPVLAVSPGTDVPFRAAISGIDFSAASVRAARIALSLLDPSAGGATLTLLHVRPPLDDPPASLVAWTADYEHRVGTMFTRVRDILTPYAPEGVRIESRVRSGVVMETLLGMQAEAPSDLVVVGTRGANWVDRLIVGSVATSVLRRASVSVLTVPVPPPAERVRLELRIAGRVALDRPEDWGAALDALTRRNMGRPARLEVSGHGLQGFVVESDGYRFRGATYEPRTGHLEIMLGQEGVGRHHLTHGISGVHGVTIVADDARRDRTLIVEEARGEAVLAFTD